MVQWHLESVLWYGVHADQAADDIKDMTIGEATAKIMWKRRIYVLK